MNTVTRIILLFCIMVTAVFLLSPSTTQTIEASRTGSGTAFPDPYLVKNINPRTHGSGPHCVAVAQTYAICSGYDGVSYDQKWRSDGTQAGTIYLEKYSKSGSLQYTAETSSGKLYVYSTGTNGFGSQLWITDGTDAGTVLVKEIQPSEGLFELVTSGEKLYFINGGDQLDTHNELWKSDGTEAGTVPFFTPGGGQIKILAVHKARLYFSHQTTGEGRELWTSDGTTPNTKILANINPGSESSDPDNLVSVGNYLFFTAFDNTYGRELWRTDGTTGGTVRVKDINEGRNGSSIDRLTAVGNSVFFFATNNEGRSLWRSDGSATGTIKLLVDVSSEGPEVAGSSLFYFYYNSQNDSKRYLGRSDGTPAGSFPLMELENDPMTGDYPQCLFGEHRTAGDTLYFPHATMEKGCELWRSDGTAASTKLVQDILAGSDSSHAAPLAYVNNLMLLRVVMFPTDDYSTERLDDELWVTDGSQNGAKLLLDINRTPLSSDPNLLAPFDGKVFFSANDGEVGLEPWISSGTENSTLNLVDINEGKWGSEPDPAGSTGMGLVFGAAPDNGGDALYHSDGTPPGTTLVKSFATAPEHAYLWDMAEWDGLVFFALTIHPGDGSGSEERYEFWRTDGSSAGTIRLGKYKVVNMIAADNQLYFTGLDVKPGEDPYSAPLFLGVTDGTAARTVKVNGFPETDCEVGTDQMAIVGNTLFISWCDAAKDMELWTVTYPTEQPARVVDINPNDSSSPGSLATYDGRVYFTADDGTHGFALWRSDGTEPGTALVKETYAYNITPFSSGFYFLSDGLWVSDGTTAATIKIADLGSADQMVVAADHLFLAGSLSLNSENKSLITSDGTAAGTGVIKANLDPRDLLVVGDKLYFNGKDAYGDKELWALSLAGLPPVAEFTAAPRRGTAPLRATFKNYASGGFNSCTWDFGDGTTVQSCDNQSHTYNSSGAYTVSLAVSGPGGSDNRERLAYIVVGAASVKADFSVSPTIGAPPLEVFFENLSTGDYSTCKWDFGSGLESEVCDDPSVIYTEEGDHTVSLIVKGRGGEDTKTVEHCVKVGYQRIFLPGVMGNK